MVLLSFQWSLKLQCFKRLMLKKSTFSCHWSSEGENLQYLGQRASDLMDIRSRFSYFSSPGGRQGALSSRGNPWVWHKLVRLLREFHLLTEFCPEWEGTDAVEFPHIKWPEVTKMSTEFVEKIEISLYTSTHNYKAFYSYKRHAKMFFPLTVNMCRVPVGLAWNRSFCVCFGGLAHLRRVCAGMVLWWSTTIWLHPRLGFAFF